MEHTSQADRRTVLKAMAGLGAASLAGCSALEADEDSSTTTLADERARELAVRFAPTLYFDEHEQWFPTDPRPYEAEQDGEPVVDGFAALEGYTERSGESATPPEPTVFYHAVEYEESPLAVVQFWMYSAFDQFTTNFHWHDWEVLHVFLDTETGDPQLYVASSHSRKVPNNEFLDPDSERIPAILTELGSHSSTLSINDQRDQFQRLPLDDLFADITNSSFDGIEDIAQLPIAYGLPRDEGSRLPYVLPELDGAPLYEHDRLPSVERDDLVDESLLVRSFDDLTSPPNDLPERETGLVFEHADRDADEADVEYDLVPSSELEQISAFTGPQLSFEFSVPAFAENAISGHITTTGVPWQTPRYDNPAADISDPNHRARLAERYDAVGAPAAANTIVASITEAVTTEEAPENEGLRTESPTVEAVALLESDPEAVPTFAGGVTVLQDVPADDHRLTVNGAGVAPHSEELSVQDDGDGTSDADTASATDVDTGTDADPGTDSQPGGSVTLAGADGEIPLVARADATKLEVDPQEADSELTDLAVEDDFAGRLYDAPLSGPDAVYVHGGGAYTTELRDADDAIGAKRVNPDPSASSVRIDNPRTGKASLATFLVDIAEETEATVASAVSDEETTESGSGGGGDQQQGGADGGGSENAIRGLRQALEAVVEAAKRAAERAEAGDRGNADAALEAVATRLERVAERLAAARDSLPNPIGRAAEQRLEQAQRRSDQAKAARKL